MPTRLSLVLVLLTAVAGTVLLAVRCDLGTADAGVLARSDAPGAEAPLVVLASKDPEELAEPTLQGRGTEPAPAWTPTGVRVRVLALEGQPVAERPVIARWTTGEPPSERSVEGTTNDDGEVVLDDVPHDGTAHVTLGAHGPFPKTKDDDPRVTGPELEIRVAYLLQANVVYVAADSGRELEDTPAVFYDGCRFGDLVHAPPGETCTVSPYLSAPSGYVAWDDADWDVGIGKWTRKLTAVYPLRREAEVTVAVLDHTGRPEPDAGIEYFAVAGRTVEAQHTEPAGTGRFRLRGVPFLRDEPLTVKATAPYLRYPVVQQTALPSHPADRTEIQLVLPEPGSQPKRDLIPLGGGSSSSFRCRGRGSFRRGGLDIKVLRHDGSPASGALVKVGFRSRRLNGHGVFRDERFPVGTYAVRTHTIGLLPVSGTVEVREGETATLVLRESQGGAVDVRVVDAQGRSVSFAELRLELPSGAAWVDEKDGIQRIDPFTDHQGRRRLVRVETGTVKIRARWASRRGEAEVDVREDDVTRVTLVVR